MLFLLLFICYKIWFVFKILNEKKIKILLSAQFLQEKIFSFLIAIF
jgi:hypothetical protein